MHSIKSIFCLFLLIGFCALVGKAWHITKDGFNINRTVYPLRNGSLALQDKKVDEALSQAYTYLGRGHQCYAFASEDGRYVMKLPRYDRYELSFFLRACPFSFLDGYREKVRADLKHRLQFILESFRIAFEDLREDTAVIYLHLHRTKQWETPLLIKDNIGRTYSLNLDQTAFILQEKKEIMMSAFQERLRTGDRKGAEDILDCFLALIVSRSRKGIYNKDPSFLRNFGWESGKGIQIDIGSFYRKPEQPLEEAREKSFQETIQHVHHWLAGTDEEMLQRFDQKAQKIRELWK